MSLLTPEIKSWIGHSEPPITVEVSRREIVKYAVATEQVRQVYLDGDEAPPMFAFGLFRPVVPLDALGPDGLPPMTAMPELPLKRIMAGGTRLTIHRPVRPGQTLVGTRSITDIFEKEGRQGPLIFVVTELGVTTAAGEPVMAETQTRIAR
ncbi:MAG: MaoC family dehydratase N-terminal domain-containing protein [Rhodospirillales bacterium]|nr:MaoC family dehydratase N-terminal domain-containing protein [Alphaproteobacteria bacterium]MCY4429582.1 MaoC family dehydratase N-terminal domain-containing protein [Rhodospirillales bacterium]